ncbi:MAG: 50S ribosomal protein L15 [Deltaproteobacteria bacterium]|jgi:large subunit ribosomal protein L15|nr:50S ribosomal protein L15 [Deltaproteobacteria bacterium]
MLDGLKPPKGAITKAKRVGRGEGSGSGKTSGRGHKGQKSRSGGSIPRGFEGGQMPLQRRLPKRGFRSKFRTVYHIVNIGALSTLFGSGDTVDADALVAKGLIRNTKLDVKFLGNGELNIPLTLKGKKISASAEEKVLAAGGKVEIL